MPSIPCGPCSSYAFIGRLPALAAALPLTDHTRPGAEKQGGQSLEPAASAPASRWAVDAEIDDARGRRNLVDNVVAAGQILDEARRIALRIASNSRLSSNAMTNALSRIQDLAHDDGLFFEALMADLTQANGDAQDRLENFCLTRSGCVCGAIDG